ncbi:MAG: M23 family metallopeptidase [Alphaproteobacteria bacterium]|nr:M23 family metallopeptidase [Alphaproteobacteria bacterium]
MIALLLGLAQAQDYAFPTSAADYGSWYLSTHFDHGGVDYACGSDRYSGHDGTDFGAGSWSGMAAGRDITAAANGVVQYVHDGERDDCANDCTSAANVVQIQHADGHLSVYGHLKRFSITVDVGDPVTCGQKIGEMGSSGNSSAPHLHFGVYTGTTGLDPYHGSCHSPASMWVSQGGYQGVPSRTCDASAPPPSSGGGGCGAVMLSGHLAFVAFPPLFLFGRRKRRQA